DGPGQGTKQRIPLRLGTGQDRDELGVRRLDAAQLDADEQALVAERSSQAQEMILLLVRQQAGDRLAEIAREQAGDSRLVEGGLMLFEAVPAQVNLRIGRQQALRGFLGVRQLWHDQQHHSGGQVSTHEYVSLLEVRRTQCEKGAVGIWLRAGRAIVTRKTA